MRIILWDFDGTLATRDGMWGGALRDALLACNSDLECELQDVRPFIMQRFPWHDWHSPHYDLDSSEKWWNHVFPLFRTAAKAFGFDDATAEHITIITKANFLNIEAWELAPGAQEVLETLKTSGWRNVITSNHVPELPEIVEGLGIAPYIDDIFCSAHLGVEKPNPAFFQLVLDRLPRPHDAYVVGDNLNADIGGARDANLPCVLVGQTHPTADASALTLREVPALLESLAEKRTSERS